VNSQRIANHHNSFSTNVASPPGEITMNWQMTCPRCGTWKQWRREDTCSTCGAKTEAVQVPDELGLPVRQVEKGKPAQDFSKAVPTETPAVPSPTAKVASDYERRWEDRLQRRCEDRLDEWIKFCSEWYGLDRLHARLIASALIPCQPHTPVWLIAETSNNLFWEHLSYSMESLGWHRISNLAGLRTTRPRYANQHVDQWMQTRQSQPRIFIDTYFENPNCWQGVLRRHGYWRIARECVRVAIHVPLMVSQADDWCRTEMASLLKLVVDPTHRRLFPNPATLSPVLMELVELLPRLNPELSEPMALLENLALLPTSHMVTYGRTELIDDDWWNMYQCLKGSVRFWTKRILTPFYRQRGMLTIADLVMHTVLSRAVVVNEVGRLDDAGILRKRKWKRVWHYEPTENGLNAVSMIADENVKWW
jgi:hypothetical protein